MASIQLDRVQKVYPNGYAAVKGVELTIADGEFIVLVGASGCGKSTTLRMIAGLETPTQGRILIGGSDVTEVPPQQRDIAMVFQNYALYPHKTVRQNLAFALTLRKMPRVDIDRRVADASRILGLEGLLDRKPGQLSGGQRQRVALGRAISREPKAFLFDEPLSNLDAKLRVQTRAELARLHRRLGATMVYVTHDQEEAMTLGDRIAVMHEGIIQQCAPPLEVYREPANVFVAGFVGSPAMNFFDCEGVAREGRAGVACAAFNLDGLSAPAGARVRLGVRPEDVQVVAADEADIVASVDIIEPLGSQTLVHLDVRDRIPGQELRMVAGPDVRLDEGAKVGLRFRRDRLHLFDAGTGRRL